MGSSAPYWFPFNSYYRLHLTGSLAHRARYLHWVIGSVTSLEPSVPTAVVALLHKSRQPLMLGLHWRAAQFQYLLRLAHIQSITLLSYIRFMTNEMRIQISRQIAQSPVNRHFLVIFAPWIRSFPVNFAPWKREKSRFSSSFWSECPPLWTPKSVKSAYPNAHPFNTFRFCRASTAYPNAPPTAYQTHFRA